MQLTIAIPTFNRQSFLARLLDVLAKASDGREDQVEILVSDNASTDGSDQVIANVVRRHPHVRAIRNSTNVGVDANIVQCFRAARGRHVWIMGDDDMPKPGVIDQLLALLTEAAPDLVYLPSEWIPEVVRPDQGGAYGLAAVACDRLAFVRRVNVWLTFLSGIVVRKEHAATLDTTPLEGTNLIQLGWVLAALRDGQVFYAFKDPVVLATGGNTGGYAVIKVFGANFPALVAATFGRHSAIFRAVIGPTVATYLPQLIWNVRNGKGGQFAVELPWADLRREIGQFRAFWSVVVPVGRAPLPLARGVLLASRAATRLARLIRT